MGRISPAAHEAKPPLDSHAPDSAMASRATFLAIYDEWFDHVLRWARALGAPEADREDIAQEVFLIVRRRLSAFDGAKPAAWLYQITRRQVRDFRRRAWIKNVFTREHTNAVNGIPDERDGPAVTLERKQRRRILHEILDKMNDDRRAAFLLFEIDGLSGEEISRIQGVSVNTVWKRLFLARKEFLKLVTRYQRANAAVFGFPGNKVGEG
jgi:RNA polymerase sigma-70 factor (ECF subfamily)